MRRRVWMRAAVLTLLVTAAAAELLGQGDRGTITGVVTDPSGTAVPAAQITATNEATGLVSRTVTGVAGTYTLPVLPIGSYTLTTTLEGFKTYVRSGVPVQVGQTTRIDIRLELGQVEERVTVTEEAPLVNTDTSDVGIVMNNEKFLNLPLTLGGDIRNPSTFIFLSPGVSGSTWEKHIAGGSSFTDAVYYDGVALSVTPNNDSQYNPSVDAIAEFKLITNDYSAEYGHALAGVTTFTLKSGTNEFHGNAFEFLRNDKLDARGFFDRARVPTRQNEFGGTAGGPIIKNRTFFFGSIDSFRRRQGAPRSLVTVPLPEFLRGDFTRWTAAIYDPATTRPDGKGGFTRDPFPARMIPTNRFSSVSKGIAALFRAPQLPDRITNNYLAPLTSPMQDAHNWTLKMDHQLTPVHKIFATFIFTNRPAIKGLEAGIEGEAEDHNRQDLNSRLLRVGYDWTIGPTMLNHFLAHIDRIVDTNRSLSVGKGWPEKLGLRGVANTHFPNVTFTQGFVRLGSNIHYRSANTAFGVQDMLTLIEGRHTIKIGAEYVRHRDNERNQSNAAGTFTFSNLETAFPGNAATGNAIASFLLGTVNSASALFYTTPIGARWNYFSAYAQDDFKVTSRLTLNLGLRWEVQSPFKDPLDRMSIMDPALPNPGAGNRPGAYAFAGSGAGRAGYSSLAATKWKDFGPRLGFAYSLTRKTALRAGYGIYYWNVNRYGIGYQATGFNTTASFSSADVGITPAFNWDDGFPQDFQKPPIISPTVQNGQNATVVLRERGGVWPYTQQWNFTVEQQVSTTAALRVSYVGIKGTHLHSQDAVNWNQVRPELLSLGSLLNAQINSPQAQAAGIPEPFPGFRGLWGSRATVAQALRPFPQYGGIGQAIATYGNSNYHSLQLFVQKRMSYGLEATFAYTFSKAIDDTRQFSSGVGQQDYYNRRAERSIAAIDQPHIVTFSYVYELPFGPGHRFLSGAGGAAGKIVGGWSVSGIQSYKSGMPLSLSVTNTLPIFNGVLRPNAVLGVPQRAPVGTGGFDPARDRWINAAAFTTPPAFTFGNTARYLGSIRTPMSLTESVAVLKNTPITERFNLQFRLEISNPSNRVVFSSPATNLSAPSFGQIGGVAYNPRNIQMGLKLMW
jgi:hypothetical protein